MPPVVIFADVMTSPVTVTSPVLFDITSTLVVLTSMFEVMLPSAASELMLFEAEAPTPA